MQFVAQLAYDGYRIGCRIQKGAGECFYMKHSKVWAPEAVRRVRIQEKTKLGEYLVVDSIAALVALVQMLDWRACLEFSRALAQAIERHDPNLHTTAFAKAGREQKILIDYLRNNRTNTSVAAFSTRARANAPVSVPVRWNEVTASLAPSDWTVETIERRLSRLKQDPWAGYWTSRQRLSAKATEALRAL